MTRLHMDVEIAEQAIQQVSRVLESFQVEVERLKYLAPHTWWQGPAADEYDKQLRQLRLRLEEVITEGTDLLQRLRREVDEWKKAAQRLEQSAVSITAGAVGGAVGGAVAGRSGGQSQGGKDSPPPPSQPGSGYTPRFDGSKPAPGMDSTYGKPGQLPLDAVVKSTPGNRDPNLYQDVINQFAVGNNPRYKWDPRYPKETYCNTFAGDVARAMGHPFPTKAEWGLNPRDRATIAMRDLWRYFTDSNAPIRAVEQGWKEISVNNLEELERYVNSGKMAVVVTPDHIAVVRPNQDIQDLAHIRIAQAGATNANNIPLIKGFGRSRLGKIRIFVHD